jgi:hypothetical protein
MVLNFMKAQAIAPADIGKCVLTFGDWSKGGKALAGNHSTKGSGLMNIFRRWGFFCFYVSEFRTSLSCSNCKDRGAITKYCKKVFNPKLRRNRQAMHGTKLRDCHGLVRCNSCGEMWNRDFNASRNIWRVSYHAIMGTPALNEDEVSPGNKYRPVDMRRL